MRDNGPITDTAVELPSGTVLVSRTDAQGRITYVNQAFAEVSGYSKEELIGSPHNLVRHPHMPREAFADLWVTIKAGKPWEGLVKNRTKLGGYYWVKANVTPQIENGSVTGFISIRSKPDANQVARAEAVYSRIREGTAGTVQVVEGHPTDCSRAARMGRYFRSVSGRLNTVFMGLMGLMLIMAVATAFNTRNISQSSEAVYQDGAVLISQLATLNDLMRDDAYQLSMVLSEMSAGMDVTRRLESLNTKSVV